MELNHSANVFRLSAILYASNNYQISPVQLHKKIIEDALYTNNSTDGISIESLAQYIETTYSIAFTDDELKKVLHNDKFKNIFAIIPVKGGNNKYLLNPARRVILDTNRTKTLNDFIAQYIADNQLESENAEAIYRYLYGVFTTNVESFRRMLENSNVKTLTQHYSPKDEDANIINGFLDWECDDKNIAIFNLSSYALEYCMLTGKKGSNAKLESLQKKRFYLDTNILYRALGINGADRKLRTLSFLRKLKDTQNEIIITKIAWDEFNDSLNGYIKKLRESETPAIQSQIFTEYISYDDIYRCYHSWAAKRSNATIDLFVTMLQAEIRQLLEDYTIAIDTLCPFSIDHNKEKLTEMAAQIKGLSDTKFFDSAYKDACDILWVEHCRNLGEQTIFSTKTFLLSSDWGLYYWDSHYHSVNIPLVMLPSQWLSIFLRYVTRTNDDFRSFVSFLNIQNKEGVLSSEEISVILSGISEMTSDIEQQRYLLESIIETEFKDGAKGKTKDQLKAIAKRDAERLLQQQVDRMEAETISLKKDISNITDQFKSHKAQTENDLKLKSNEIKAATDKIEELKTQISERDNIQNASNAEIDRLTHALETKERVIAIIWKSAICIFIIGLALWFFCSSTTSQNIMGKLLRFINGLNSTQKYVANGLLLLIFSAILIPTFKSLCNNISNKQ